CTGAIGSAGADILREQLKGLGENLVWVEAGSRSRDGVRLGSHQIRTLIEADADAILRQIPLIRNVSPQADAKAQAIYGDQNWSTSVKGVSPAYFQIRRWTLDRGTVFWQQDVELAENVCVLGRTVANILFDEENPVGKTIRVKHLTCHVSGVMQAKGQSAT